MMLAIHSPLIALIRSPHLLGLLLLFLLSSSLKAATSAPAPSSLNGVQAWPTLSSSFASLGAYVNPNLSVSDFGPQGLGLAALAPLPPNTTLLRLPLRLALSADKVFAFYDGYLDVPEETPDEILMAIFIARVRSGLDKASNDLQKLFTPPLFAHLLALSPCRSWMHFGRQDLQALPNWLRIHIRNVQRTYNRTFASMQQQEQDETPFGLGQGQFLDALCSVHTRSVLLGELTILPLIDMFNHHPNGGNSIMLPFNLSDQTVRIVTSKEVTKCEPLNLDYGHESMPAWLFLANMGFFQENKTLGKGSHRRPANRTTSELPLNFAPVMRDLKGKKEEAVKREVMFLYALREPRVWLQANGELELHHARLLRVLALHPDEFSSLAISLSLTWTPETTHRFSSLFPKSDIAFNRVIHQQCKEMSEELDKLAMDALFEHSSIQQSIQEVLHVQRAALGKCLSDHRSK